MSGAKPKPNSPYPLTEFKTMTQSETILPDWLVCCEGHLYDCNRAGWHTAPPFRANYQRTFTEISTVAELKATLRAGGYAWPGGYPLYFITSDGGALAFETVRAEFRNVADSIRRGISDGWRVVGCSVNWESDIVDDHTGQPIESTYGVTE